MTNLELPDEFSLLLPKGIRRKATELAEAEGISLEDFIMLAVAEKLARIDTRTACKQLTPELRP